MNGGKVRVADYIARTLVEHGIRHVFMITGGGAMHLNDAMGRQPGLTCVFQHHEQACAMAAEGYFRLGRKVAAVNVTSGPGGLNALTGVHGAWTDSMAMVVLSGQVKRETLIRATGLPLRQMGDQEVDIIPMAATITKYAQLVMDPAEIRYHLEKALFLATHGRPGPVWLDVPLDVQGALVDPEALRGFDPAELMPDHTLRGTALAAACRDIAAHLEQAERPVLMLGTGVWLTDAAATVLELAARWQTPLVTAWNAHDLVPDDHPCYVGRPGTIGDRAGNFAVQNADLLLVLGCRLNIRQISYNWRAFARAARVVMVDVDPAELKKPSLTVDLPVHADLKELLPQLAATPCRPRCADGAWLAWNQERRRRYPVVQPRQRESSPRGINPYHMAEIISHHAAPGEVMVCANATPSIVLHQVLAVKAGQRLFANSGCAAMGYDLPAAIGACFAHGRQRVMCLAGDGSIMMNLQELQTIAAYRLPITILLLNNRGYHSIRQTQNAFFPDGLMGFDAGTGVPLPDFRALAAGFGLPTLHCATAEELAGALPRAAAMTGPVLVEVVLDPEQLFEPKLASRRLPDGRMISSPLEDLYPFLSREALKENMIVPLQEEE